MGIYDRNYFQDEPQRERYTLGPTLPKGVKILLLVNCGVFLICFLARQLAEFVYFWFSVFPLNWLYIAQIWRLFTYQFLHDLSGVGHIFFNMLMLYFFGPLMERMWGTKRFVIFYLLAGAAGGVVYSALCAARVLQPAPMVGASGGLYGILGAVAVLFPHMQVLLFGVVPMSMRAMAILTVILSMLFFASGSNAGGEAAHLTGMAVGVAYVYFEPLRLKLRFKRQQGRWQKKIENQIQFEAEVDRILEKIHKHGIQSLTAAEKETLREATRREQQQQMR